MNLKFPLIVLAALVFCGFGWFKKEKKTEPARESLPAGYALIFKLLSDEKDVSKILIIKRESRELHDLIKEIAAVTGKSHNVLEQLGKRGAIDLKDQELPLIETAARESISKEKAKQLIGAKGADFEFRLLLTQDEALNYGRHLALAVLDGESDAERREFLQSMAKNFAELQERVFKMLSRAETALGH